MWWLVNQRYLNVCCGCSGQALLLAVGRMHKMICFMLSQAAGQGGAAKAQQALFLFPFHLVWPVGSCPAAPAKLYQFGVSSPRLVGGTPLNCQVNGICTIGAIKHASKAVLVHGMQQATSCCCVFSVLPSQEGLG